MLSINLSFSVSHVSIILHYLALHSHSIVFYKTSRYPVVISFHILSTDSMTFMRPLNRHFLQSRLMFLITHAHKHFCYKNEHPMHETRPSHMFCTTFALYHTPLRAHITRSPSPSINFQRHANIRREASHL